MSQPASPSIAETVLAQFALGALLDLGIGYL